MNYRAVSKDNIFIQNSTDNAKFLVIKNNGYQFIINKSGESIINEILENTNTNEVFSKIKNLYPDVEEKILLQDIEDMVNILFIFGIIVKLEHKNLDSVRTSALGETEYQIASHKFTRFSREY